MMLARACKGDGQRGTCSWKARTARETKSDKASRILIVTCTCLRRNPKDLVPGRICNTSSVSYAPAEDQAKGVGSQNGQNRHR